MKILLSAYACEPNKGSEPGVGWNWALALVRRGHDVWVITRKNNQSSIEQELARLSEPYVTQLHFIYYDLPSWATWWKKGRRGVHLYYLMWQWGAYQLAKKEHHAQVFDLVHHVTFVSVRQPSFMGNLGIPFIFGPVAGGENAPWRLRKGFGWKGWQKDFARDLANLLVRFDPLMWRTFSQAERIYVTSAQTLSLIPQKYKKKSLVQLAIAVDSAFEANQILPVTLKSKSSTDSFRILYIGHFLYLKGMHLGLAAYAKLLDKVPNAQLTMVGHGPEEKKWRELANNLGINQDKIEWKPWVPQKELAALYLSHDVFLFPSLRDSGGMVVLEAMSFGLPVICLKLGGPGVMVDNTCGRAVDVNSVGQQAVTARLTDVLVEFASRPELMQQLRDGAKAKASASSWDATVERVYILN
jgi:glycosyltransferase involved in cell wall biosynthesis